MLTVALCSVPMVADFTTHAFMFMIHETKENHQCLCLLSLYWNTTKTPEDIPGSYKNSPCYNLIGFPVMSTFPPKVLGFFLFVNMVISVKTLTHEHYYLDNLWVFFLFLSFLMEISSRISKKVNRKWYSI